MEYLYFLKEANYYLAILNPEVFFRNFQYPLQKFFRQLN
jgi:hypothetical protein